MPAISSDAQSLPIGARVRVNVSNVDFFTFDKTETGTVIRSTPGYLRTEVEFDQPIPYTDWRNEKHLKKTHNFNPDQLVILEQPTMFTIGQKVTRKALPDTFGRNNEPIRDLTITHVFKSEGFYDYVVAQMPDGVGQISAPAHYFEPQND